MNVSLHFVCGRHIFLIELCCFVTDWDPFAEDLGLESDCDTEEEIRRSGLSLCHFHFVLVIFLFA